MDEQEEDFIRILVDQKPKTNSCQSTTANSSGENGSPTTNETQGRSVTRLNRLELALAVAPIIAIPALPLMLALYFIAYITQAFRSEYDKKVDRFMGYLTRWLFICVAFISIVLLLSMLIFGVTPSLKHLELHGVSITRWIGVIAIICLFLTDSMLVHYHLCHRRHTRKCSEETFHLVEGLIGAFSSLTYLFVLFSVIRVAPILKEHTLVGLPTQKWVWMILLVVLGHHIVCVFTSLFVVSLREYIIKPVKHRGDKPVKDRGDQSGSSRDVLPKRVKNFAKQSTKQGQKYIVYYAEGLRGGFNFVLTSLLLLLTWILYIGSRLNLSSSHIIREVYDSGFWTVLCILVSAFVLLVKRGIFLTWEARIVHGRFCEATLCAVKKLYLIGIIAGKFTDSSGPFVDFSGTSIDLSGLRDILKRNLEEEKEGKKRKKTCATGEKNHDILPCAYDAKIMTRYLLQAEQQFSQVGYAPDFVRKLRREILQKRRCEQKDVREPTPNMNETLNWYGQNITKDIKLFNTQLTKDGFNNDGDFGKWTVKYLRQCLEHGRILAGELEWVHCLNDIMTAVLFGAVMIVWLFLTGIATTKVVVLIASPILAASFIFGESCKNLYQGIMFTYVKRPFEVGEICTIDDTQVKILKIGIRRTLCSRVVGTAYKVDKDDKPRTQRSRDDGTTDEVIYPNTMLATVPIVKNYGKQGPEQEPKQCPEGGTKQGPEEGTEQGPEQVPEEGPKEEPKRCPEQGPQQAPEQGRRKQGSDRMELRIDPATNIDDIERLLTEIKIYMRNNQDGFKKDHLGVLTNKIGNTLVIEVHFVYDNPPLGSVDDKNTRRLIFLSQMKSLLDKLHIREEPVPSSHERNKCICCENYQPCLC